MIIPGNKSYAVQCLLLLYRYEMAGRVLRELGTCGPLCPPLPPPSLIHLLLARTLLLSGDPLEAWSVCERLIDHLSILELEECTPHSVLGLCQSLLLGALSLVARGDWDKAKCSSHKQVSLHSRLKLCPLQEIAQIYGSHVSEFSHLCIT